MCDSRSTSAPGYRLCRHVPPTQCDFGRYVFGFLERRGCATTILAGRLAVAQPPGAWIGGYRAHLIIRSKECKARPASRFPRSHQPTAPPS